MLLKIRLIIYCCCIELQHTGSLASSTIPKKKGASFLQGRKFLLQMGTGWNFLKAMDDFSLNSRLRMHRITISGVDVERYDTLTAAAAAVSLKGQVSLITKQVTSHLLFSKQENATILINRTSMSHPRKKEKIK